MLNNGESRHSCLVPDLRCKALCLSPLNIRSAVFFFFFDALQQAEKFSTIPLHFIESFKKCVGVAFCQMLFLHWLLECVFFFSFTLLKWWILLIGFWILNQPCIPGINSIWPWCRYFMYMYVMSSIVEIYLLIFVEDFSLYINKSYQSVLFLYFLWFWYQDSISFIK